tara:strand:+ start:14379 stop:14849 length:471 start_codon:yes stop_codon:yes gene_type:complete
MVVLKRKKLTRYRGSKTHGCGSMKKRRGKGNKGGSGKAGTGKHGDQKKPSIWNKNYFGKKGFATPSKPANTINLVDIELRLLKAGNTEIDLTKLGYDKLLSRGKVTKKYKIIINSASKKALEKVKAAGGEIILPKSKEPEKPTKPAEPKASIEKQE